jgi:Tfp pilus assembly protein PilO
VQVKVKQYAVIGLAVFLGLFLWYKAVYSSYQSKASKANTAAQDAEASISQLQHQLQTLTGGPKNAKTKQASTEDLQAAIPSKAGVPDFLRAVQIVRNEVGIPLAFQTITPQPPTLVGNLATINFGITLTGSYQQVRAYVDRLMSMPRLVAIDTVGVTAAAAPGATSSGGSPTGEVFAGQGAPPLLTVQMTARLFATPTAIGGGTTPNTSGGATPRPPAQNS